MKKKCKNCGIKEQYDINGLCVVCNYNKMLGIDITKVKPEDN